MTKQEVAEIKDRAEMAIEGGHEYVGFDPKVVRDLVAALTAAQSSQRDEKLRLINWLGNDGFFLLTAPGSDASILAAFEEQEKVKP